MTGWRTWLISIAGFLPVLVAWPWATAESTAATVKICELFSNPTRWNGKMVRVRGGLVRGSPEDGLLLSGEQCPKAIQVKGVTWPKLIFLEAPENAVPPKKFDFQTDNPAMDKMNLLFWRVQVGGRREHVEGTVVGVFETQSPLESLVQESWEDPHFGFGHLNAIPAQIVVKTIEDMRIESDFAEHHSLPSPKVASIMQ